MTNVSFTIKIPKQVFVGFQRQSAESYVPHGFVAPYSTDAAGKKRQDAITAWSRRGIRSSTSSALNCVVLDNVPMVGFRISRTQRNQGWRNNDLAIRIEDPRGFELEISVVNLIMITDTSLIQNGEILAECVWGRDGVENRLLPVNSAPYLEAMKNTERLDKTVSVRKVKPGNKILMHSGLEGIYMGAMYAVLPDANSESQSVKMSSTKRHIVRVGDAESALYHGFSAMKISEIIEATEMDKRDLMSLQLNSKSNNYLNCHSGYNLPLVLIYDSHVTFVDSESVDLTEEEAIEQSLGGNNSKILGTDRTTNICYRLSHDTFRSHSRYKHPFTRALTIDECFGSKVNKDAIMKGKGCGFIQSTSNAMILNKASLDYSMVKIQYVDAISRARFSIIV